MKGLIKKYLDTTFLTEDKEPKGLKLTKDILKQSGKDNKAAMNDVKKSMEDYTKMDGEKENEEATKKYNYDSEQKEFHDDNELQKGSLATMKVNGASEEWEERQKMAIEGDATMGNAKEGDVANVVSADDAGSLGPEGDKETYKNAQTFKKKSKEAVKG